MNRQSLLLLAGLLACCQLPAMAGDHDTAASKNAAARYAADKELCTEEANSTRRMQCLRDARAEYDKALAATATGPAAAAGTASPRAPACPDCGKVLNVALVEKKGEGGALGVIGGGVIGAVLGHQVGGGRGKDLATLAGAAGGAYAGHKAEENLRSTKVWSVHVRLDSGEERSFEFDHDPGLAQGDAVKLSGNTIIRR